MATGVVTSGADPDTAASSLRSRPTGTLDALLDARLRCAFVSNSDDLGAIADVPIAASLAAKQMPMLVEAARSTPADRKRGHPLHL